MLNFSDPYVGASSPKSLVILFHGYGADADNLIPLAHCFAQAFPECGFWIPKGLDSCEVFPQGRQWFSLQGVDLEKGILPESLWERVEEASDLMMNIILEKTKNFSGPIVLAGFSQGATLAFHMGIYKLKVSGVLGYSGFYKIHEKLAEFTPSLFWAHGEKDQVVPISLMKKSVQELNERGLTVRSYVFQYAEHTISDEGAEKGKDFLRYCFAHPA